MYKHAILNLVAAGLLLAACNKTADKKGRSGPPIKIDSITPLSVHGGDTMTVFGRNLPTEVSSYTVTLNGHRFVLIGGSADSIRGVVPKMAGSGKLVVNAYQDTVQGPAVTYNYVVKVSTIAGSGLTGTANGAALASSFYCPWGITADANGDLYIADCYNRLLRKHQPGMTSSSTTPNSKDGRSRGIPWEISMRRTISTTTCGCTRRRRGLFSRSPVAALQTTSMG